MIQNAVHAETVYLNMQAFAHLAQMRSVRMRKRTSSRPDSWNRNNFQCFHTSVIFMLMTCLTSSDHLLLKNDLAVNG